MTTIAGISIDPRFTTGRFPALYERADKGALSCAEVVRSEDDLVREFNNTFGNGLGVEAFEELLNLAAIRTGPGF